MKTIVLGDPHFQKKLLPEMRTACSDILDHIKTIEPDFVICLGDTLDTHERIDLQCFSAAVDFFYNIAELCDLYVLIGNHDRLNNQEFMTDVHPFKGLKHERIKVIWKTEVFHGCAFVPYVPNGRFLEALEGIEIEKMKYIFAHQEFKGCNLGVTTSTKGDVWSEQYPPVISGHIHDEQTLRNVYYPGTFIQQNYGEREDKGILLLDMDTNKRTKLLLPNVPKFKTFKTIGLDNIPIPEDDAHSKLILDLKEEELKSFKKTKKYKDLQEKYKKIDIRILREDVETRDEKPLHEAIMELIHDPVALLIFQAEVM